MRKFPDDDDDDDFHDEDEEHDHDDGELMMMKLRNCTLDTKKDIQGSFTNYDDMA